MPATLPRKCPPISELVKLRKTAEFSQADVARHMNVTPAAISIVEAGHREASKLWRRRYRLALFCMLDALGADINDYQRIAQLALERGGESPGRWMQIRLHNAEEVERALTGTHVPELSPLEKFLAW